MNLFGRILPQVQLRFNSAYKFASDSFPRSGIRKFGPYDANLFSQGQIKCGVICSAGLTAQRDALVKGFINGDGSNFPGFTPWFKARLIFDPQAEKQVSGDEHGFRQAANDLAARNCDLVFVIVGQRNEKAYRECKTILLSNGTPCQFVTATRLQDSSQRPWTLGNIALATYAKIGGTPWVVADSVDRRELVMGVSRV